MASLLNLALQRCLIGLVFLPFCAFSAESPDWKNATLTGDWSGIRSRWSDAGVNAELLFKGNLMANPIGDARHGSDYMQNLELKVGMDADKLWGIRDGTAFIHVINNSGGKMNAAYIHSIMGTDNTEANENIPKLYQAWINKNFFSSTVSVLTGIYPIDSEFYVTDASGVFLNPSFGMAAEVTQTGKNGPSIYPLASLGVRFKYQPVPIFYIQTAVVDGNPGGGRNPHWTRFNPLHGDGFLHLAEICYQPGEAHHMDQHVDPAKGGIQSEAQKLEARYEPIGKYAFGHWYYTKPFDDLLLNDFAGNPLQHKNQGYYILMENSVYRAEDMERDAAIFFRYGRADKNVNIFDYSNSFGVRIRGLLNGRVDDFFGIAVSHSHASENFRLAKMVTGVPSNETSLESSYRAQLKSWLVMQVDIQRIFNPGLSPTIKNATIFGLRCEISL